MSFIIGLLTAVLVLDCLFLVFLILLQLPKKEAGMGTAFGGGATDALFGAGSGNALTATTKYAAGVFLGLALLIPILGRLNDTRSNIEKRLQERAGSAAAGPTVPGKPDSTVPGDKKALVPPLTNSAPATTLLPLTNPAASIPAAATTSNTPAIVTTNAPAATATNAPKPPDDAGKK
ncbi:MAG: preprotein translocase subunit SecG [Verrucomicrobia bacterium]|nr:preprotein translocase subunit SecG [Verrucomicrobiota bacterium]